MASGGIPHGPFNHHFLRNGAQALMASKHFIDASFTMLVYDHILTFGDEVERIWKPKFTGATLLFLINRYLSPLQYIVNIASFFDLAWSNRSAACRHFVHFPGAGTMCSIAIIEVILITRTYALYGATNRLLLAFLLSLFVGQMAIMGVALSKSHALHIPPGLAGCILTGTNGFFAAFWIAPLVTDTVIFILTLWKTHQYSRQNVKTPLLHILRRDGIMYFTVIFAANLLNVLIYSLAEEEIKAIGASFSQLATTVMISRLQLNLRNPAAHSSIKRATSGDSSEMTGATDDDSIHGVASTIPEHQRSMGMHLALVPAKIGEASSNFFAETLRSLGQPVEDDFTTTEWSDSDVIRISPNLREGGDDLELTPVRHESVEQPADIVRSNGLFPPPRSNQSLDELADGIAVSPALIDGPDGPMLYEEWKRRTRTGEFNV